MFFLFDAKNIFGRTFIKIATRISYKSVLAHRAKMIFGSKFILACVYGGKVDLLKKNEFEPATILFRPAVKATDFELWECRPSRDNDCKAYNSFKKINAQLLPIFEGSMYAFITDNYKGRAHYVIKARKGRRIIASNAVIGKIDTLPSIQKNDILSISKQKEPEFSWSKEQRYPYWISFLLINDGKKMVTGIYSYLQKWRFPNIDVEVPYYYHEPKPKPRLTRGQTYEAIYMPVDKEGWIPYIAKLNWIQES